MDLDDYKTNLTGSLSATWEMARTEVKKAQSKQKRYYDQRAKGHQFRVGDHVFVHMPGVKKGKAHKFARPFHGPYWVVELSPNDGAGGPSTGTAHICGPGEATTMPE